MQNTTQEKINLYIVAAIITAAALWIGYEYGLGKGQQIGTPGGRSGSYEEGLQDGLGANLSTELQEWLGEKPNAQVRTP